MPNFDDTEFIKYEPEPVEIPPPQPVPPPLTQGGLQVMRPDDEVGRGAVRQAMARWPRRWRGIDAAAKEEFAAGLRAANRAAAEVLCSDDPEQKIAAASTIASIVRTAVAIEAQTQADEHLADKNSRLDAGLATENVQFKAGAINRLPLPASLDDEAGK